MQALSLLDFVLPDAVIEKKCYGVRIEYDDRSVEVQKDELIAALVNRDDFDRVLAEKAAENGALFLQGERVTDVVETNHSVIVTTETKAYQARYLIGADGVHSRVANLVRPPFKKDELALAAVSQVPALDEEVDTRLNKTIFLRFGIAPTGYGWLFPHRGNYSVGAAGIASEFVEPRQTLTAYARSLQVEVDRVRGYFIPIGGIPRRIAANRILLAGDAAGFADPLHGEGIVYAILSGICAANAVIEGLEPGRRPWHAAAVYSRECERRIRRQLEVALRIARFVDRFPRLVVSVFIENRGPIEQYLEIALGRSDYRSFLKWVVPRMPFYLLSSVITAARARLPGAQRTPVLSHCAGSRENRGS